MSARTRFISSRYAEIIVAQTPELRRAGFGPADLAGRYASNVERDLRDRGEHAAARALLATIDPTDPRFQDY